jgi:polysaccharide biosynthesis/export protein
MLFRHAGFSKSTTAPNTGDMRAVIDGDGGAVADKRQARSGTAAFPIARLCCVLGIAAWLCGCAMSPGMTFSESPGSRAATGTAAGTQPLTASDRLAVQGKGNVGAQVGQSQMIEITNELVEKEISARRTDIAPDVQKMFAKAGPYTLGPGDVLSIVVWDHPELNLPAELVTTGQDPSGSSSITSGYTLDSNGMIQYAYVGPVKLQGLTELQARDYLAKRLSQYVRNPQLTLRIQSYRSKRVYLDGEVRTPGVQVLNDMAMTLPEAINRAGGFTAAGDRSQVAITRNDKTVVVNIPEMIRKGVNPDNIVLRDGDLVRVFSQVDSKTYVIGEVAHPGSLMFNNGKMTLNEALGNAGGIDQNSGDASQVYVIRRSLDGKPTVFHLDASSPSAMAVADGFDLKSNDVVFVDSSALVRWSRVMNLLLPSTQAAAATRAVGY